MSVASHSYYSHYRIPQKASLKGAIQTLEDLEIPHSKSDLFRSHDFSRSFGYRAFEKWNNPQDHEDCDELEREEEIENEAGEPEQAEAIASLRKP